MELPNTISAEEANKMGWRTSQNSTTVKSKLPDTISADEAKSMGWNTTQPSEIASKEEKPPLPILTNEQGGFGTALKDVAVGAGKDLLGTARNIAGGLQDFGQRIISQVTRTPLTDVQNNTGFQSLRDSTSEGAGVADMLAPKSKGEQTGAFLSTAAQLATPFAGGTAEKLWTKGKAGYDAYKASQEAKATADASSKITEMKQNLLKHRVEL